MQYGKDAHKLLRSVWFFVSSLMSKRILILFPKSNAKFGQKLQECGTTLKVFCSFWVYLLVLHYSSYCVREWAHFRVCKMTDLVYKSSTVLDECFSGFWKSILLLLSSYLLLVGIWWELVASLSHKWRLPSDLSCCQESSTHFKPVTQQEITKDWRSPFWVIG